MFIVGICVVLSDLENGYNTPNNFALLIRLFFLPAILSVNIRRMHDSDHSGWWCICPLVGFVFLFFKGTIGSNRFGEDPYKPTTIITETVTPE